MTTSEQGIMTSFCPQFHKAVELIGRRWTGAILRAMLGGSTRFSDLARDVPGLSDRLLSERLRELEAEGIVTRTVIPEMPVRVEYHLTEKGASLKDVLVAISDWASEWVEAPAGVDENGLQKGDACEAVDAIAR
jgi:DNA-binding HxlR family transcriptional regulator